MTLNHPKTPFKNGVTQDKMIMSLFGILGICKVSDLKQETLIQDYGSVKYTKDYDDLPLVLRLWLTSKNWSYISELAEKIGCNDRIFYSDIVEIADYENDAYCMLSLPLIIMDKENAVCLAPREIRPEHFSVSHVAVDLEDYFTPVSVGENTLATK